MILCLRLNGAETFQRYNRNLMAQTLIAMRRIADIKEKRQLRFYKKRMAAAEPGKIKQALKDIDTGMDLLIAPQVVKDKAQINKFVVAHLKKRALLKKMGRKRRPEPIEE